MRWGDPKQNVGTATSIGTTNNNPKRNDWHSYRYKQQEPVHSTIVYFHRVTSSFLVGSKWLRSLLSSINMFQAPNMLCLINLYNV